MGDPGIFETLALHLMIWIKDQAGRYLYVSPPFLKRFAVTMSQVLGHTDLDLFPGAESEIRANDLRVLSTHERLEAVERAPDATGLVRAWFVTKFYVPSEAGPRVAGLAFDITEYERIQQASQDSEATYQQILDSLADMVLVKGEHSRLLWANRAFRETYGMSNEQLRGLIDRPSSNPTTPSNTSRMINWFSPRGRRSTSPRSPSDGTTGRC